MTKAQQDLETKTDALDAELEKVNVSEVTTQTVSKINEVLNVKQEESEAIIEEKKENNTLQIFP